jgi:hypothetical protein
MCQDDETQRERHVRRLPPGGETAYLDLLNKESVIARSRILVLRLESSRPECAYYAFVMRHVTTRAASCEEKINLHRLCNDPFEIP